MDEKPKDKQIYHKNRNQLTQSHLQNRKQIVFRILKEEPDLPQQVLMYPRLAYQPNFGLKNPSSHKETAIKTRIHRLTKVLFTDESSQSFQKRSPKKLRSKTENVEKGEQIFSQQSNDFQSANQRKQDSPQRPRKSYKRQDEQIAQIKQQLGIFKRVKQMEAESLKKQNYIEKILKIKQYKMKRYLKNKFAIDTRTIESYRQGNFSKQKAKSNNRLDSKKQLSLISRERLEQFSFNNLKKGAKQKKAELSSDFLKKINSSKKIQVHIMDAVRKQVQEQKKKKNCTKELNSTKNFNFGMYQIDDHPAENRFKKMINELNAYLNRFGVSYGDVDSTKLLPYNRHISKFKFYVGYGNNRNLIVAVLKKRWWWHETKSKEDCNLLWSQIKDDKVLKQNEEQIEKRVLEQYKLGRTTVMLPPKIIHNHYTGNNSIGNKKDLFLNLIAYCKYKHENLSNFIPQTYHIRHEDSEAFSQFQSKLKTRNTFRSVWVIKPGENSNRGNGIQITKSFSKIQKRFQQLQPQESLIIQKYISNPLLYNKRKFDIRLFLAAITIGGITKYFWYEEGYIRTSSYTFHMSDFDDVYIHLTNDAIQSESEAYGKYQPGNKVSYRDFDKYLKSLGSDKEISIQKLHEQMKKITLVAIKATYPKLNKGKSDSVGHSNFCFELFGLDFMIDESFKPYLIQVNTNPCLESGNPCLERLIPQMLDNLFKISLDPIFQPMMQYPRSSSNNIPDQLYKFNRFQMVFDAALQNEPQYEAFLLKSNDPEPCPSVS